VSRRPFKVGALVIGLLFVAAGVGAATSPLGPTAPTSRAFQLGIYDDSEVFGHPSRAFPALKTLHAQVLRANLRWGGAPLAVATKRPENGADPSDPAYNWSPFDEMVKRAADVNVKVMATIVGTPSWANGGKPRYYPPKNMSDLRAFATAAAKRYSGDYTPPGAEDPLPAIRLWLAWNEPNNPVFIRPQFKKQGKRFVVYSPVVYAKMCNAIVTGIHSTRISGEKVACGATAPRGNNSGNNVRPSITPLVFLSALKKAGARFDFYAHHPYYSSPSETPATPPKVTKSGVVTLGNIGDLLGLLQKLYPGKHLWITEYGYQTKPPDRLYGVSYANQAKYLAQAVAIMRKNPRIDMLIWFLLRDDRRVAQGWQSGLLTAGGKRKPAFATFSRLARHH
jgi:Glycosyl hydrolase catalytic core